MWEEYKFAAHHCREKIPADKVQLELNIASTCVGQQKDIF